MKTRKAGNKKEFREAGPHPHCGDFQKMAEMMQSFCPGEGEGIDRCSIMRRMMGQGKEAEAEETKETQKPAKGGKNE